MATFAERLKELREEKHLSQKALGDEIGVSENTIYRWESATQSPREEYVTRLSNFFQVGSLYLTGVVDERNILTDEESSTEKEDEEFMLKQYRLLSPTMKKMIRLMVSSAYVAEKSGR